MKCWQIKSGLSTMPIIHVVAIIKDMKNDLVLSCEIWVRSIGLQIFLNVLIFFKSNSEIYFTSAISCEQE